MGILSDKIMKELSPVLEARFNEIVKSNQEEAARKLGERLDKWDEMVKVRVSEILSGEIDDLIELKVNKCLERKK